MPSLDQIRRALAAREPQLQPGDPALRHAAVAMILRPLVASHGAGASEVLLIERAEREGDPWSGHMAFPGGRVDAGDASVRHAAERETREEVGIDLGAAELLGRLDDLGGHRATGAPRIVVSAFVYHLSQTGALAPNHEVRSAFWFPLADLRAPERQIDHRWPAGAASPFPGIRVGASERHVVWGLTYRFLEVFFSRVAHPLPDRWLEEHRHHSAGSGAAEGRIE